MYGGALLKDSVNILCGAHALANKKVVLALYEKMCSYECLCCVPLHVVMSRAALIGSPWCWQKYLCGVIHDTVGISDSEASRGESRKRLKRHSWLWPMRGHGFICFDCIYICRTYKLFWFHTEREGGTILVWKILGSSALFLYITRSRIYSEAVNEKV